LGRALGEAARCAILRSYISGAKRRGHAWELSEGDFDKLTSADCFYCGEPPGRTIRVGKNNGDFTYNGIDRVDNLEGYTSGNVVTCCWKCNNAKKDMTYPEFADWITRLAERQFTIWERYEEQD